jgi:hypothetical protein
MVALLLKSLANKENNGSNSSGGGSGGSGGSGSGGGGLWGGHNFKYTCNMGNTTTMQTLLHRLDAKLKHILCQRYAKRGLPTQQAATTSGTRGNTTGVTKSTSAPQSVSASVEQYFSGTSSLQCLLLLQRMHSLKQRTILSTSYQADSPRTASQLMPWNSL